MTDKKASTTNEQSDSVAQDGNALDEKLSEQNKASEQQEKALVKKPPLNTKKTVKSTTTMTEKSSQKISKTALLSLVIAIATAAGIGGLHFWQTQQQQLLEQRLSAQNLQSATKTKQQITQLVTNSITQQQTTLAQQLKEALKQFEKNNQENQAKIDLLESTIVRLSQNQPSDWLIHEAEYLIRIASRTIWLEQDTKAAVNLLTDADTRLQELNDPEFLPIRQFIHDDIESLKLMPTLRTEEAVLTLMSLSKQINVLPLAMVYIPDSATDVESFTLSEDANDWRANLEKTWKKFLKDFITVSRRTANVEPLMSPQHQQNLRQNLALKLQLAQWAASEGNAELYLKALDDAHTWVISYFDMEIMSNQQFIQGIETLKSELIAFDYPSTLHSLKAIRKSLASKAIINSFPKTKNKSSTQPQTSEQQEQPELKTTPLKSAPIEPSISNNDMSEDA